MAENRRRARLTMFTVDNDTIESSQCDDLSMSNRGYSDKSQQRLLASAELVEQSQSRVLHLGGVSCRSSLNCHGIDSLIGRRTQVLTVCMGCDAKLYDGFDGDKLQSSATYFQLFIRRRNPSLTVEARLVHQKPSGWAQA